MLSATDFLPSYMMAFMNLADDDVPEFRVRIDLAFFGAVAAGHRSGSAYFGRFAPYFERRCLRFLTPWVSSTPRRMW